MMICGTKCFCLGDPTHQHLACTWADQPLVAGLLRVVGEMGGTTVIGGMTGITTGEGAPVLTGDEVRRPITGGILEAGVGVTRLGGEVTLPGDIRRNEGVERDQLINFVVTRMFVNSSTIKMNLQYHVWSF